MYTGRSPAKTGRLHPAIKSRTQLAAFGPASPVQTRPRHQRGQPLMNFSGLSLAGRALAELRRFGRRNLSTELIASSLRTRCVVELRSGDRRTSGLNATTITREAADAEDEGKARQRKN
jgi:hypothetical protein